MTRKPLSIGIMSALAAATVVVPDSAHAQYRGGDPGYYHSAPGYSDGYQREGYRDRGDERAYYGQRHRCRSEGSTGTIIGAIAGGLLGNSVAGYGDRAAGTIIGGVGGALAGRAIDRDC
jgi:Glycine zipper 2TM domain